MLFLVHWCYRRRGEIVWYDGYILLSLLFFLSFRVLLKTFEAGVTTTLRLPLQGRSRFLKAARSLAPSLAANTRGSDGLSSTANTSASCVLVLAATVFVLMFCLPCPLLLLLLHPFLPRKRTLFAPSIPLSHAHRSLAQGGKLDLALQTLRRMRSDPSRYPAPNTVCYNAALMALMRRGRWREARELLSEGAAASTAAGSSGKGEEGERELEGGGGGGGGDERSSQGAAAGVLDFLSYNSVIRACAAAGEAKEVRRAPWLAC